MSIEVKELKKYNGSKSLKAFADIEIDGKVVVKKVKLLFFQGKLVGKLPDSIGRDAKYYPIVMFNDINMYEEMTSKLVEAYNLVK